MSGIRRRDFVILLGGGAAAAWPPAAHAQQAEQMRRVGVLIAASEDDPDMRSRLAGFRQGLERLGWADGRNLRVDYVFAGGQPERFRPLVRELIARKPDVLFAQTPPAVAAMQRETREIPIVFADVSDPVGPGFIASLARPGGNLTGVISFEASITGKWLAMLKEIAPGLARVALLGNPKISSFDYYKQGAEATAPSLGIELVPNQVETAADIERAIDNLASRPIGGLALPPDSTTILHRDLIIALAAKHRLPAVYAFRAFVLAGGLMSYTIDYVERYRQAAGYVDRILRGANPAELPVEAPTKFETVVNLKTAKAMGLTVPPGLLVAADEAAWPLAARAQQAVMPVVGFLDARSRDAIRERLRAFRQGLKDKGYVEGENVTITYRFANNQTDRLPTLAAELVRLQAAVIATAGDDVALAAKAATTTIPLVCIVSQDPVQLGLVTSMARPGANVTGINFFTGELVAKRLEILRELVPGAVRVAVLVNRSSAPSADTTLRDAEAAARAMQLQIQVFDARTRQEIEAVFASFARERPDALFVASDTFLTTRRVQLVNLAARHAIPTAFPNRESAEIGGLMSYGASISDAWRQSGTYVGQVLKGTKPADLPVVQSSKFELVINASTARMLGLTVPDKLLVAADEVIE